MTRSALINHPLPYADETLVSWLWRLTHENYAQSPALLLRHLRETASPTMPVMTRIMYGLHELASFRGLAELTNTSVETVYQHTLHRFVHALALPEQARHQLQVSTDGWLTLLSGRPPKDFYAQRFGWCPYCLKEARYVRLHWHVPLITCCEVHQCWLLEACPTCHRQLKESDILQGHCSYCEFCLEQAVSIPVPAGDLLLAMTAAVMAWLYKETVSSQVNVPNSSPAALLRVLQGLRYNVQRAGNEWDFHHVPLGIQVPDLDIVRQRCLTQYERGCLYATAFRGLQDWPHGFFAFLDAYRKRPGAKEESGLRREFGTLYISWIPRFWKHPAFDFVQEAFNDYLVNWVPVYQVVDSSRIWDYPDLLERFDYLDRKRATAYLDICISSIHRLIEEKNLSIHYFEGDTDIWFAREELDRLKQKWQKHMTWPQVVQRLGVSLTTVQGLAEAELVRIVPVEEGIKEQKIYIDEDSVETLIQKLKAHTVVRADVNQAGVLLRDVCVRHGSMKMNTAQVFERVLAGKLLAYHPHETILPLREMWFVPEDIDGLADTVKDEQNWFTKSEVKEYLGVGWPGVTHMIATGFLHSEMNIGPKQFFRRSDVRAIRNRWIFGGEMARLLEVPGSCIGQLVRKGALQAASKPTAKGIGCYIFDRAYFMAWHQEHIMTPEMRKLTPNLKALQRRLKTQGIEPIVKFPNVYSRKEVMAVINQ